MECFTWIRNLWEEVVAVVVNNILKRAPRIPNEILVFEILSRLPPDDIVKCRSVCKQWNALIPTPPFYRAHRASGSPTPIVFIQHYVTNSPHQNMALYFFDHCAKEKNKMLKKVCPNYMDNMR